MKTRGGAPLRKPDYKILLESLERAETIEEAKSLIKYFKLEEIEFQNEQDEAGENHTTYLGTLGAKQQVSESKNEKPYNHTISVWTHSFADALLLPGVLSEILPLSEPFQAILEYDPTVARTQIRVKTLKPMFREETE